MNKRKSSTLFITFFYTISIILSNISIVFATDTYNKNKIITQKNEKKCNLEKKDNIEIAKNKKTDSQIISKKIETKTVNKIQQNDKNETDKAKESKKNNKKISGFSNFNYDNGIFKGFMLDPKNKKLKNSEEYSNGRLQKKINDLSEKEISSRETIIEESNKKKKAWNEEKLKGYKAKIQVMTEENSDSKESRVLQKDEVLDSLELKDGILDLNGHTLEIKSNLQHIGGIIYINKGKLIIHGNYNLLGTGILNSGQKEDYILVEGKLTITSTNVSVLDKGTLELKGDFLFNSTNLDSFQCGDEINTLLSGSIVQNIKFNGYEYSQRSSLGNTKVQNEEGIKLGSTLKVQYFDDFDKVLGDVDVCFMTPKRVKLNRHQTINGNMSLRNINLSLEVDNIDSISPDERKKFEYEMKILGNLSFCFDECNLKVKDGVLDIYGNLYGLTYDNKVPKGELIVDDELFCKGDISGFEENNKNRYIKINGKGYIECQGNIKETDLVAEQINKAKSINIILSGKKNQKIRMTDIGRLSMMPDTTVSFEKEVMIWLGFWQWSCIVGDAIINLGYNARLFQNEAIKDNIKIVGNLWLAGNMLYCNKNISFKGDMCIDNSELYVVGNIELEGIIYSSLGPGHVNINGDLKITRGSILARSIQISQVNPSETDDYVFVAGNIKTEICSYISILYGVLEVQGNLEVYGGQVQTLLLSGSKKQNIIKKPPIAAYPDNIFYVENLIELGIQHDPLGKIEYCNSDGVNDATGNFMDQSKDLAVKLGELDFEFTRTYNSQNDIKGVLGKGWSFGFEGSITNSDKEGYSKKVTLPTGNSMIFIQNTAGDYISETSRDTLIKNSEGKFILTRPNLEKYGFNQKGYLEYIEDRNGNRVNITTDSVNGRITQIKDLVGREFTLTYNDKGFLTLIKDPLGREVRYEYNNDKLIKVTNSNNNILKYSYDIDGYLSEIKNSDGNSIKIVSYSKVNKKTDENTIQTTKNEEIRVKQTTDEFGNTFTYTYDLLNKSTEIVDKNNRKTIKKYDINKYLISETDPEGKVTYTEYKKDSRGQNRYGEISKTISKEGFTTKYETDNKGNIIKTINPDGSSKENVYDSNNNLILETDETGRKTHYIYDNQKINLLKKIQALDENTNYTGTDDRSKFAITEYVYYSDQESIAMGCPYKGLLKRIIDANGNSKRFTYDKNGNVTNEEDEEGNITIREFNKLGWKTKETSPKGDAIQYFYNNNGDTEKVINPDGSIERSYFDNMGRKISEIKPEQYKQELDDGKSYKGIGFAETQYYSNGKPKFIKDAEGNVTQFSYDLYGNKIKEITPSGGIYLYEYDVVNRLIKTKFKEGENKPEILLEKNEYTNIQGKKSIKNFKYINDTDYTSKEEIYDYADRLIETKYNNNMNETIEYYPNGQVKSKRDKNYVTTQYRYDGLNRLKEEWIPIKSEDRHIKYSCIKYEYDNMGNKIKELKSKTYLNLDEKFREYTCQNFEYYKNNKLKSFWYNDGRKEEYTYYGDGSMRTKSTYKSNEEKIVTEYVNDFRGNVIEERQKLNSQDFYDDYLSNRPQPPQPPQPPYNPNRPPSMPTVDRDVTLITRIKYDKNGNIINKITPDGRKEEYTYDNLNREIKKTKDAQNEFDQVVKITNETQYNWDDKPISNKDAKGNILSNSYNSRGFLEKSIDANGGVTYRTYDRKGRIKFEVTPENYSNDKSIAEMNRTEFIYDNMDNIVAIKQYYNMNTEWKEYVAKAFLYDDNGNKIKELSAEEYEKAKGDTLQEKIENGEGTDYEYDLNNKLISILTNESKRKYISATTKYEYDSLGRKVKQINASGTETIYNYDDADNVIKISVRTPSNAREKVIKLSTYDLLGNKLTETDGNKNVTTYTYNSINKIRSITFASDDTIDRNKKIMKYDRDGNLSYEQNSDSSKIIYVYNLQGKVKTITRKKDISNITTSTRYDINGNKRFEVNGEGHVVENNYDKLNRLISKTMKVTGTDNSKTDHTTRYEYDKNNNLLKEIDWLGNEKINKYDPINRLVKKIDANGKTIESIQYNNDNLQVKSTNALGNSKQFSYNSDGNIIKTIDEEGNSLEKNYDNNGNVSSESDGKGNVTTYRYDEFNRLIGVRNALGQETIYTYDLNGNRLTQTDGKGNTTTYQYNAANKISKIIYPKGLNDNIEVKGKIETYKYDSLGQIIKKTDRNGNSTTYSYDINGNKISETITDSENTNNKLCISREYDKNNNEISMTDSTGKTIRKYDELGRVIEKTVPKSGTMTFKYDVRSEVQSGEVAEESIDPKGNKTTRVVDKVGRLKKVISNNKTTEYEYNDNGTRKSLRYPGGTTEVYSYYKNNRLKELKNLRKDGTVIDNYTYEYDKSGNQTKKQDSKGVTEYEYDKLNRLIRVNENTSLARNRITEYTYDAAGNRTLQKINDYKEYYIYDEDNRLESNRSSIESGIYYETKYSYDNNGNQVKKVKTKYFQTSPAGAHNPQIPQQPQRPKPPVICSISENTFDLLNRLTKSKVDSSEVKNIYNGEGKRVGKEANGDLTTYVYEGEQVVLELDKNNGVKARNTQGVNLISREIEGKEAYYLYNGHVDITSLVDDAGKEIASYYYDAFGNILEEKGSVNNPYRYAEYEYDKETKTYYCMSRMYDPEIGRFLSEDTYKGDMKDPLSLNVYTYVNNNPMTYSDPDGHFGLLAVFASAVVGGAVNVAVKSVSNYITKGTFKISGREAAGAFVSGALEGAICSVTGGLLKGVSSAAKGVSIGRKIGLAAARLGSIAGGALLGNAIDQKITTGRVNWVDAAASAGKSMIIGGVSSKAGKWFSETQIGKKISKKVLSNVNKIKNNVAKNVKFYTNNFKENIANMMNTRQNNLAFVGAYGNSKPNIDIINNAFNSGKNSVKNIDKSNNEVIDDIVDEITEGVSEAGKLKSVGNGVWESTEGLIYGQGSKQGNRVLHVLEHASPDPTKPLHSVFNVSKDKVLGVVDEAWSMRSGVTPTLQKNGNQVFNIPMGRVVGTNGETSIRIVVKNGTSEVVTGFPVK